MSLPPKGAIFKAFDIFATEVVQATGEPFVWCESTGRQYSRSGGDPAVQATVLANDPHDMVERRGWITLLVALDDLEIVPDDQVPDEVWAKLALLRLTGDAS